MAKPVGAPCVPIALQGHRRTGHQLRTTFQKTAAPCTNSATGNAGTRQLPLTAALLHLRKADSSHSTARQGSIRSGFRGTGWVPWLMGTPWTG